MGNGSPDDYSNGQSKFKVSGFIFIVVVVGVAALIAVAATKRRWLPAGEFRLIAAMAVCVPFMLVRVIYILCIAFAPSGSTNFNLLMPNATIEGVMSLAPEFVIVAILVLVGFVSTPSKQVATVGPAPKYEMMPEHGHKYQTYPGPQQPAWTPNAPSQGHVAHHPYDTQ